MEVSLSFIKSVLFFTICLGARISPELSPQDYVQISSDEEFVMKVQSHEGILELNPKDRFKITLGKIGRVVSTYTDGYVNVVVCEDAWLYSVKALTKLETKGVSGPEESSDCIHSEAIIEISHVKVDNYEKLACTVHNKPNNSYVRWVRVAEQISRDAELLVPSQRITASTNTSTDTFELQIRGVTSEDAGWYTCEVRTDRGLLATGAVKLEVEEDKAEGEFAEGDVVQVLSDESTVKRHFQIELPNEMRKTLGKIGKVRSVDSDMDLYVEICGEFWHYPPETVTKLATSGSTTPTLSTNCVRSDATVSIDQKRDGDDDILDCIVLKKPEGSKMFWVNKYGTLSEDMTLDGTARVFPSKFRLQLRDFKREYDGWYTCELRKDGGLVATAAVEVRARTSPDEFIDTTRIYPEWTTKPDTSVVEFEAGDLVQVLSDEDDVERRFGDRIGFTGVMRKTLGKIGRVQRVDDEKDLVVELCDGSWWYSPDSVTKLASAGNSTPEISSDCTQSKSTVRISKERLGGDLRISCAVAIAADDEPYVLWIKDGAQISRDFYKYNNDSRISIFPDFSANALNLKIKDVKDEDAGWYTCELRTDEELLATAAVHVETRQPRTWTIETTTFQPTTTETPDTSVKEFKHGDVVQVLSDEETVKRRFGILNFNDEMRETLGKIGKVISQDSVNDVNVEICGAEWWYTPNTISKIAAAVSNAPEITSECVQSNATVSITEERKVKPIIDVTAKLVCTVANMPVNSDVIWKNDGKRISSGDSSDMERFSIHEELSISYGTSTLQIDHIKPEDSGWYTCEVTTDGKVAAIAAKEFVVHGLPITISRMTTEATTTGGGFAEGDLVWVLSDKGTVERLEESHGGWTSGMEESLGKIGRVYSTYTDADLRVEVCNTSWVYNPEALIKIASAGASAPEVSSNCVKSSAIAVIKKKRSGNVEKLICTVFNMSSTDSYVSWAKEGARISCDVDIEVKNPRIKIHTHSSSSTYTLEIANMKPEDVGWYTCEVRSSDDKLEAVRAVELTYHQAEEPTAPTSCVDCTALSAIEEELQGIKYLITNSTSVLQSRLNDVRERLEMVERRFSAPTGDTQGAA